MTKTVLFNTESNWNQNKNKQLKISKFVILYFFQQIFISKNVIKTQTIFQTHHGSSVLISKHFNKNPQKSHHRPVRGHSTPVRQSGPQRVLLPKSQIVRQTIVTAKRWWSDPLYFPPHFAACVPRNGFGKDANINGYEKNIFSSTQPPRLAQFWWRKECWSAPPKLSEEHYLI